jgi:hypothetical protein
MNNQVSRDKKTTMQKLMEAPKGGLEYNPTQSFALHVYWVVRSPTAASEMIKSGFKSIAKATMRDTPTTLAYVFRISRDQRLATKLKDEVKTIGQHPHYRPAFKSIQMGIPQPVVEMKLKHGGIDTTPLSWGSDEPITGHETELDFDPVVLECTEVYLDNKGFYEHGASYDWMNAYPEIMKASRSLKPVTYCLGTPSDEVWERTLESFLQAIRFTNDDRKQINYAQPGLFLYKSTNTNTDAPVLFLELDLVISNERIITCRSQLSLIQQELEAPFMIILPTMNEQGFLELRAMFSLRYSSDMNCPSMKLLTADCDQIDGRIIVFGSKSDKAIDENILKQDKYSTAQHFLHLSGLDHEKISILDGHTAEETNILAGYSLHPLFQELVINDQLNYQMNSIK